ncbi:MAG: hypothetical protein ACI4GO_06925 [Hominenteromicrobium sp.]
MLTSLIVSGAAYVISLVANLFLSPAFNDTTGQIGNGINVFLLLAASVFLYTNSIAQKLFTAILLVCNYSFLYAFTENLLGVLPFAATGFAAILIGILVYVFFSFLSLITFVRPFHYFANRGISVLSIGLCCAQILCLFAANGSVTDFFGANKTYAPRFFLTIFVYLAIAFTVRAAYNAAKFKERECLADYRDALLHAEADYFSAMVGSVTNARTARDHHSFILSEISDCARRGDCEGVLNTIADEGDLRDPLLAHYSENPYVNAVVAAKAAYAKHCGIRLESNVELGATRLKTIEFCVLLNDMLTYAIDCAEHSNAPDKLVRMTVLPGESRIAFETVYSAPAKSKKRTPLRSKSFNDAIASLLEPKEEEKLGLDAARGIIERYSGTMNLSAAGGSEILRIAINN